MEQIITVLGDRMSKICVDTCITGDYDDLKEIKNVEKNIDYFCYFLEIYLKTLICVFIFTRTKLPCDLNHLRFSPKTLC